jgi:hypothetical protein
MKKEIMISANQRAKYSSQSQAMKDAHKASRGTLVTSGKLIQTNIQKIKLSGIQQGSAPTEPVSDVIDFNMGL